MIKNMNKLSSDKSRSDKSHNKFIIYKFLYIILGLFICTYKNDVISQESIQNQNDFFVSDLTLEQKKDFYGDTLYENYLPSKGKVFTGIKLEDQAKVDFLESLKRVHPGQIIRSSIPMEKPGMGYLTQYLYPWKDIDINAEYKTESYDDNNIELNFENVELSQFVKYLSELLNVTFITADNFDKEPEGWKKLADNKITFKSHKPLTKKQVWEIGLTFLEMTGFSVVPESTLERTYLIVPSSSDKGFSANKEPLPTFIGVDPDRLPNNDSKIRYVYFVRNADVKSIADILNKMSSLSAAKPIIFQDFRAIILTDKSSNIKSIMNIIVELDKISTPEVLSVIRLTKSDAKVVADLINNELLPKSDDKPVYFGPAPKKAPTTSYFSKRLRVVADPRTNSLVILGPEIAVKRLENFILKEIDQEIALPYAPLHIYKLKHLTANQLATMLNSLVKFGERTPAAESGGVRSGDQYFDRNLSIFAENSSNSLVIKSNYDDYLKLKKTIDILDVEQPQVAIKVLILDIDITNSKELGTQLRNKVSACNNGIFDNITFQNSNLGPFVEQPSSTDTSNGAQRLLGNLIRLAVPQVPGTTLITLGRDICGVWGLIKVLETHSKISTIANPFLITTNKYPAKITVGETRRIQTAIIQGNTTATSFGDDSANLTLEVVPTISYDDMVTLEIFVEIDQFTNQVDPNSGNKNTKGIQTTAIVADREVLALGGLTRTTTTEILRKMPILGDIPLLGVFAKYKTKQILKRNLLILMSPQIIRPDEPEEADYITRLKINDAKSVILEGKDPAEYRDPIFRWYFNDHNDEEIGEIDKFVSRQSRYAVTYNNIDTIKQAPVALQLNNNHNNLETDTISSKANKVKSESLLSFINSDQSHNKEEIAV